MRFLRKLFGRTRYVSVVAARFFLAVVSVMIPAVLAVAMVLMTRLSRRLLRVRFLMSDLRPTTAVPLLAIMHFIFH